MIVTSQQWSVAYVQLMIWMQLLRDLVLIIVSVANRYSGQLKIFLVILVGKAQVPVYL